MTCASCGYWVATIGDQCESCYDTNVPVPKPKPKPAPEPVMEPA